MRPRVSRIAGLSERLSTLEHVVSYPSSAAATSSQSYARSQAGESNSARTDQPISSHVPATVIWNLNSVKRETPCQRVSESPAVSEDTPIHQVSEARRSIQQELQNSNHLSPQRRTVLGNALLLVNKISASSTEPKVFSGNPRCADDHDASVREEFSLEVYLMMSMDMSLHQHSAQRHFYWPDHISIRCLEHMSLSLAEGKLDRQTSLHYQVCVYTKALFFLARVPQQRLGGRLRTHVKKTQERYASAALRALDQINFVGTYSITLVQALLSGALLHQMQGYPTRGWTLTAFASQILVAMNYHTIRDDTPVRCQEDQDARFCLFSCFYLDKMLSMLLLRPPSLPRLKLNPASLIPLESGALSLIVKTVVELAQIQEAAMEVVHRNHGLSDISDVDTTLDAAIQNLASLRGVIDERCRDSSPALQVEWIATEFRYHAIMATLLHLSPRVQAQPQAREECLVQARHAFQALGRLHKLLNEDDSFVVITRTVLFYPMTPYYLLFCNVVGTSNTEDYQLMHETTRGLHRFINTNPSISKLYHLFTTFLNLCDPLMQGDGSANTMTMPLDETNLSTMPSSSEAEVSIPQIDADNYFYDSATRIGNVDDGAIDPNMVSSWNNAQMWELFGVQSSLEWVDSEVSHAMPERYQ
ncbi:hypothetical protein BO79DRAFT_272109 [Aspergillus costaricaensis CBS 115574]|uniref:Uncharacterized protein n=1 Tax=Aspergillus costaricaensis CBS 115574 TaxID=1448317 RepID=A0ACD1I7T9_9EURO|nr:hypothetical protein BO79DRAFT_272109 [Aspergillus costaricaensis CBS 115574]RAK85828.1 hypothetical protein BO79DRAFT_272109 [Aspergillus costaricaensis CBS 115574]